MQWGEHQGLFDDLVGTVEDLVREALGKRYEPGLLTKGVAKRLDAMLGGNYTAEDAAGLITYDLVRLLHKHGQLINYLDAIGVVEAALLGRMKAA